MIFAIIIIIISFIGGAPFRLYHNGSLVASNADIYETIHAGSGEIAGWALKDSYFGKWQAVDYYGNGVLYNYGAGLYSSAAGTNSPCLAIGYMPDGIDGGWGNAEFRVTGLGELFCDKRTYYR